MDTVSTYLFVASATALLGSPGPGIAALVAVGRTATFTRGLAFYATLQLGLAVAAAMSAAGLWSVLRDLPAVSQLLTLCATAYLLYLAVCMGFAPVGSPKADPVAHRPLAAFLLGIANPKAYLAFATLFASRILVQGNPRADIFWKWVLCVGVMLIVDMAWLLFGSALAKSALSPRAERILNLSFGAIILAIAVQGMPRFH